MKIAIDPGHNVNNDGGAYGLKSENSLIMAVSSRVITQLNSLGHEVINCLPTVASSTSNSLRQRVATANASNADIFASIHFNAFNGRAYGTEVFHASSSGSVIAKRVVNNIARLGYWNRGIKTGNFYVIKNTKMPAVLIECCFCDSQKDMNLFDPQKMAIAITEGLTAQSIRSDNPEEGNLIIQETTYLKPSTEQIGLMDEEEKAELIKVEPRQYRVNLITDEEGHHFVRFLEHDFDGKDSFFVSMAHSRIDFS